MSADGSQPVANPGLGALESRVRADLACLNYPPDNWVPPTARADGTPVRDVVVVGAGMCGLAASFALLRRGITNLCMLDRANAGEEGPWLSYARMQTLRSPKQLTGPAMGMASLTFRAWYTAQFGEAAWDQLDKIPRPMWMDYLVWYRRVLALPVENGIAVTGIRPQDAFIRLDIDGGPAPFVLARKVVLATGRDGVGKPSFPAFLDHQPRGKFWAHSSDTIDFAALKDKRVIVIGGGSSAMDNAAEALEHGAKEVRLLMRRRHMPRVNKLMGVGHPGFTDGFPELDDAWRWRIMVYSATEQTPAPRGSTLRVSRHANAYFHFGLAIRNVDLLDGALRIETSRNRTFHADFVIASTGFTADPLHRPELSRIAHAIAVWGDRIVPPEGYESAELARFPYLGPAFEFLAREPAAAPWLANLHCFNYAANLSLGKISGDIPAVSDGASRLAQGIAAAFYKADIARHWEQLLAYSKPELRGDEWRDADA